LEAVIARGLRTFVEVGRALREIRDRDLHRAAGYPSFDAYCRERWGFSRVRSTQLIAAAETAAVVTTVTGLPAPANERQARALGRVAREARPAAWAEALETAPGGRVTAEHVAAVVRRHLAPAAAEPAPGSGGVRDGEPGPGEQEPAAAPQTPEERAFWRTRDDLERAAAAARDLCLTFGGRLFAEDLLLPELGRLEGLVAEVGQRLAALGALADRAAARKLRRGGAPAPRPAPGASGPVPLGAGTGVAAGAEALRAHGPPTVDVALAPAARGRTRVEGGEGED
jgi:hypothetical protein